MSRQRCVSSKISTLPQRCHNIGKRWLMFRQCSGNVVWILWQCHSPIWEQHWDNVLCTLWQCCSRHWGPTLRQYLGIVVSMLFQVFCPTLRTDIETMFRHHCVNVVSMLVPNGVLGHFWSRMTVTFQFEFSTHLKHQHASLHCNNHIYKTFMSNTTYHSCWGNGQMMNFQEISSLNPHSSLWM